MEIGSMILRAVERLRSEWGIPESGFIAGGAIANLIWEEVSGRKMPVNDIDVFVLRNIIEHFDRNDKETLYRYAEMEREVVEDGYTGLNWSTYAGNFYAVVSSERNGMWNTVEYDSNSSSPNLVLDSFDLNCVQVGYDIETGEAYWTKSFENFLETKTIEIVSLTTPAHTAIRIAKKSKDLGCPFIEEDMQIISHCLDRLYPDISKNYFMERYAESYRENKDILKKYFHISRKHDMESYVIHRYGKKEVLYGLDRSPDFDMGTDKDYVLNVLSGCNIWGDELVDIARTAKSFLFYMKNIRGDKRLMEYWRAVQFEDMSKIDCHPSKEDLEQLKRLIENSRAFNKLKHKPLSQQIGMVKCAFAAFPEEPEVAIAVLESGMEITEDSTDDDILLMGLSVRRAANMKDKRTIDKILNL